MTIAELITLLQTFPSDQMVVVRGYEGGFDDPSPYIAKLVVDGNWAVPLTQGEAFKAISYYGRHDDMSTYPDDYPHTQAVCL